MTTQEQHFKKMTETKIPRLIIGLGIPTTISMLITTIYNMADTFFVGQLGTSQSGAVGIVFSLMAVLQAFGFMYGQGAGSIIARKLGEGNVEEAKKTGSTAFMLAIVTGLIICIIGILTIDNFMRLLGSTETILPYAREYGRCILLAAPFMISSNVLNNILRYEGKAFYAMIGLCAGGVLNMIGDPILIFGLNMGVRGAGVSTAISQMIGFFILLYMFLADKTQTKFAFNLITPTKEMISNICFTGLPSLIRQSMQSISGMFLNTIAAGFGGDAAVAAMSIVGRINFFCFAVGLGVGQGCQPVTSFNYGAKRYDRVKEAFFFTWKFSQIMLSLFVITGLIFSDNLIQIFRDDIEVIKIGTYALKAQLFALFFVPFQVSSNMLLQSTGQRKSASFLSLLRNGLYFIPILLVLSMILGLRGVQVAQPISDVFTTLTSIPFIILFFKKMAEHDGQAENAD